MSPEQDQQRVQADGPRPVSLVWIDASQAVIVRRQGDHVRLERMESDVPAHHKSTGHVRHDPGIRHGGAGAQTAGERHRLAHLRKFEVAVAKHLAPGDKVLILGPGTVHERLAQQLEMSDTRHGRQREIACEVSGPLTDRQLIARLRGFAGVEPRRRTVGSYRWSDQRRQDPSPPTERLPRRVAEKRPPGQHRGSA